MGEAREKVVPEGISTDARLRATVNAQGHSIVGHKQVCPLLLELLAEEAKHEAKLVSSEVRTAEDYNNLAEQAASRGQMDKAIAAYHEVIRMQPENANAYNCNLGTIK